MTRLHLERHLVARIGWLRAAVLGANDGIISTSSLILGVAATAPSKHGVVVVGLAGLVAGAMSMAAGEYVSVSSQADTEQAELAKERQELATDPASELQELTHIYVARGVVPDLAQQVARELMDHDALGSHARDELGLAEVTAARPIQAALASACAFSGGAAAPLLLVLLAPTHLVQIVVGAGSLLFLAALGAIGAKAGGAAILRSVLRVTFWGALAMIATTAIGTLFGATA